MFSEVQRNYIEKLVLANKSQYPYYIAYTKTNVSNQYNNDEVSFYVILSKKPITANSRYNYTLQGDCVRFNVKSSNASYNYHSERVTTSTPGTSLVIDNWEFVYTNAEFSAFCEQPNLILTNGVEQSHFDGVSIILLIILISVIFTKILRSGKGVASFYK